METIDCLVIGAGVVGLAIARALAQAGRQVVVAERETLIGSGASSRNSEVIHAGIYYPPSSLKAKFCVRGRDLLYRYSAEHGIPHDRIGKVIVATSSDQLGVLNQLVETATKNGVDDLRRIDRQAMAGLEPALEGVAGLLSPSTGIIDSHAYLLALQADAENAGAAIAFGTAVTSGRMAEDGVEVTFGPDGFTAKASLVINAAGLSAHKVAHAIEGTKRTLVPEVSLAKGNYFGCSIKAPFRHLIYPVPEPGGLGTHLTLDMTGKARFGPDVEWIDAEDYVVDPARSKPFYAAVRRYWPSLPDDALYPDYAGIRVKIAGRATADFLIDDTNAPALIHLFGFESPGLTSSLAIAEHIAQMTGG